MDQNIADTLRDIAKRYMSVHGTPVVLAENTVLAEEAGIDSLRMIDIMLDIEDHFHIKLEEAQFQSTRTFGDLVALIARLVQEDGAAAAAQTTQA